MLGPRFLAAAIALALTGSGLFAQVAGRLTGTVVDQSGAGVPNATVNILLPGGQDPVLTTKTNESGLFSFIAVRPETYDIAVEAPGFAKVMLRQVRLSPGQELGLPAIRLEVAAASETVEVEADVQGVQLTNSEVAATITNTMVQNLPVLGRQVTNLLQTQAGVSEGTNTTSVNGLRSSFSTVTLDGINIQDNFIRTNSLDYAPMRTTIDQIAEITVLTSNPSAMQGGGSSQMILSTRSGTNAFHGSVYWFNRNSALAANDWFNNRDDVDKTKVNLNQPGASLGGPILKDKLFFFANYELYRDKSTSSRTRTVLSGPARTGVFTYPDATGALRQVNLLTLKNFSIDPRIQSLISQLPASNAPGGDEYNTQGYRFNARSNEYRDQFVYRGDYYLTTSHSFSGTYNYIDNPTDRPDQGAFYTTVPPVTNTIKDHMLSLAWRWMVAPTLTNELRGGFMRADTAFVVSNDYPQSLLAGLLFSNPTNTFLNQGRKTNTYQVQDNANWVRGRHQISFGFQSQFLRASPYNDAGILPTYTLGLSTAFTGGLTSADLPGANSAFLNRANSLYANLAGIISSAAQTFNVTSRSSGFVPGATNLREFTHNVYAGYVQDNWKVASNFTLNLGLRYEYWTPLDEKNSLFLAPVVQNNNIFETIFNPNATLDFIGKSAGRPFYKADKNNFAPTVGFAWDPFESGRTSIRAGYSVSYVNDSVVTTIRNSVGTANGLQFTNTQSNLTARLNAAPEVAVPVYKVPRTLADNYATSTTSAIGMPALDLATPFVHQWNFGVEQDVRGLILSARYVGNRGVKLLRAIDYNQVLYNANGFLADFLRARRNAELAQSAGLGFVGSYNPAIAGSQPLTVFPLLASSGLLTNTTVQTYLRQGEVGELANTYQTNRLNGPVSFFNNPNVQGANIITNNAQSRYHSLQLEAVKRMRSGLQFQFNYTLGKVLSNSAGDSQSSFDPLLDNANPSLEWARSPFDIRHVFKANYYYELPYGRGKRWSGNSVMNAVLGNWAISGIWSYQSGSPFSILSGRGTLNRGGITRSGSNNTASILGTTWDQLKDVTSGVYKTGDKVYFLSPSVIGPNGLGASPEGTAPFAGQLFFNPAPGAVGNLQRRMFSGPWQWQWDIGAMKRFTITERVSLDVRGELFNWMNHPTFFIPPATSGDYGLLNNNNEYNINSATFGQIESMNYSPRVVQLGAYLRF